MARLTGKSKAELGKAREPYECYKHLPDEWVITNLYNEKQICTHFISSPNKFFVRENSNILNYGQRDDATLGA